MSITGTGFWSFSNAIYARPGVAEAALSLQDLRGADVNIVLFCFWRARLGLSNWAPGEMQRAVDVLKPVNAVLAPYRQARRALKNMVLEDDSLQPLYDETIELELRIEAQAQLALEPMAQLSHALSHFGGRADEMAASVRHLAEYTASLPNAGREADALALQLLRAIYTADPVMPVPGDPALPSN